MLSRREIDARIKILFKIKFKRNYNNQGQTWDSKNFNDNKFLEGSSRSNEQNSLQISQNFIKNKNIPYSQ
jgi:hypothetical protein